MPRPPRGTERSGARTEQPRCAGTTKGGAACRSFALPGGDRCLSHDPERAAEVRASRAKGGKAAGQLRVFEGRRKKLDSAEALVRFCGDVVQDVLGGSVTPDVGRCVLYGTSVLRQLVEAGDLEKRLEALEAAEKQQQKGPRWHA